MFQLFFFVFFCLFVYPFYIGEDVTCGVTCITSVTNFPYVKEARACARQKHVDCCRELCVLYSVFARGRLDTRCLFFKVQYQLL